MKRTLCSTLIGAALATCAVPSAMAYGFDNVYFFGDSLTDAGAFASVGLPANYRFTTDFGKLYADWLYGKYMNGAPVASAEATASGTDYAVAGSTSNTYSSSAWSTGAQQLLPQYDTAGQQVAAYLKTSGGRADPNALYSVWIGGNDISAALTDATLPGNSSATAQKDIAVAAQDELAQIDALRAAGAKYIMVMNLPNVGLTPNIEYTSLGLVEQPLISGIADPTTGALSTLFVPKVIGGIATSGTSSLILSNLASSLAGTPYAGLAPVLGTSSPLYATLVSSVTAALGSQSVAQATATAANSAATSTLAAAFANTNGAAQGSIVQAVASALQKNGGNYTAAMTAASAAASTATLSVINGTMSTNTANAFAQAYGSNAAAAVVAALTPILAQATQIPAATVGAVLTANFQPVLAQTLQGYLLSPQVGNLTATISSNLNTLLAPTMQSNFAAAQQGLASAATSLVNSVFNPTINTGLAARGNIIEINVNRFLNEIFANPVSFGIMNVAGTACAANVGANNCKSTGATFDATQEYLFVDGVHPTPQAHEIIAQFIESTLDAPMFAAQLAYAQPAAVQATQSAIDQRTGIKRSVGNIDTFASVSRIGDRFQGDLNNLQNSGTDSAVTAGAEYQYSGNSTLGMAFTATNHKSSLNDVNSLSQGSGSFSATNELLSVFTRYEHGPLLIGSDLFIGNTTFSDMTRTIQLGTLSRTENASDSGYQFGARATAEYDFSMGAINFAPVASLAFRQGVVGDYNEGNVDATSMRFEQQRINSLLAGLGAKIDAKFDGFHPFASATWYKETEDKNRTVSAAQQSVAVDFTLPVFTPATSYTVTTVGFKGELSKHVSGYVTYGYTFGLNNESRESFGLGLQGTF